MITLYTTGLGYTSVIISLFLLSAVFGCFPGEYKRYSGDCMTCPKGTYSENPPSYRCLNCPNATSTLTDGATNHSDCVYENIGCYDNLSPVNITFLDVNDDVKVQTCVDTCAEWGYLYAAIQNATTCFCAQTNDGTSSSGCNNTDCGAVDTCGGETATTVYRTGRRKMAITTINWKEEDLTDHGLNVSGMSELEFRVLACKDAHVRLMYDRNNITHEFIEVVFGHSQNTKIGIRNSKHGNDLYTISGSYLDCFNWKFFRVSWENGTISIFIGEENKWYSHDTGIVFDVNYLVISAYVNTQCCWQMFADVIKDDICPPLTMTTAMVPVTTEPILVCECPCGLSNISNEALQEKIDELKRTLTVDVKTTSQYERKFVCADDPRPSAKGVGIIFGPVLLSVVIGLVVLADFPNLVKSAMQLKKVIRKLQKKRNKEKYKKNDNNKEGDSKDCDKNNDNKSEKNHNKNGDPNNATPDIRNNAKPIPTTAWAEKPEPPPSNQEPDQNKQNSSNPKKTVPKRGQNTRRILKAGGNPPSKLSHPPNNQRAEECNEVDDAKKKAGNGVKKPSANNLLRRNVRKNNNVSKTVSISET